MGLAGRALHRDHLGARWGRRCFQYVGARIRERITWQPIRAVDAVGGAALSAVAVLLVAWALGVAVSGSRIGAVTPMVRDSAVLAKVDETLPADSARCCRRFNNVVGTTFFPRYLEPFAPERIVEVEPGDRRMLTDPDVVAAEASVLKVRGTNGCGSGVEGTGFLFAPGRLMTNAHVVAGVTRPRSRSAGRASSPPVVLYDPDLDVAVLAAADDGALPSLPFDTEAGPDDNVAVVGYPEDGPYDVAGRPDPRRAAAALARHLRRGHRHPRGVLAARPDPTGQLRRPDRHLGRRRRRAWCSPRRSPTATRATR